MLTMRTPALLLVCAVVLQAQEGKDVKQPEIVRYRDLPEIVQEIQREVEAGDKASVVWLIDPLASLKTSGHGDQLATLIPRLFKKPRITHSILAMGDPPTVVQRPTDDMARFASSIKLLVNGNADPSIKNCLANVREAAKIAGGASGAKKYVVLFTMENGDNEDNLEETLRFCRSAGVVLFPIVPESVYSDPYWAAALSGTGSTVDLEKFKKLPFNLRGPESAFLEFPYGWPFTRMDPTYTVPSGFGPYALDRLATYTGGRTFLLNPDKTGLSFCRRTACGLCSGNHAACNAVFDELKLKLTAPEIGSREAYGAKYSRERLYGVVVGVWERLHKENILRGMPPLKSGPGGLTENRGADGKEKPFFGRERDNWKGQKEDALKNAEIVDKAAAEVLDASKKLEKESSFRTTATADALGIHLLLLAQGYRQFAAFCDEIQKPHKSDEVAGSVFESPGGERIIGHVFRQYYLCHGGARLKDVAFLPPLGGLHAALDAADRMIEKHKGTPWEVLIRRASVPVFLPYFERPATGNSGSNDRSRPRSGSTANNTETPAAPARPARPGTADSGSGSGTATGDR